MSTQPLVSVIVSNFNYGAYLAQCIDSALSQTYQPIEVIVVDDGSTDGSRAVIDAFGDRIQAICKTNGGQASCWNAAFPVSRGEIVVLLDSDDYLFPNAVAAHVEALSKPGVVRSQGYLLAVDEHGTPTGERVPRGEAECEGLGERALAIGPAAYTCPPTSGNAWTREFLQQVLPLPPRPFPDGLLFDAAPLLGDIVTLAEPVAAYRRHSASLTNGLELKPLSIERIRGIIADRTVRAQRMADTAATRGVKVNAKTWLDADWRIQTLRYLHSRCTGEGGAPDLVGHLRSALRPRVGFARRTVLVGFILAVRMLPEKAAIALAERAILIR